MAFFPVQNGRVLGFHRPSLWISFQVFNWLKSSFSYPASPEDPETKRKASWPRVRWGRSHLCSLIFTSSLGVCRGGRSGWPPRETGHSPEGASLVRVAPAGKRSVNRSRVEGWKFNFHMFRNKKGSKASEMPPVCALIVRFCLPPHPQTTEQVEAPHLGHFNCPPPPPISTNEHVRLCEHFQDFQHKDPNYDTN